MIGTEATKAASCAVVKQGRVRRPGPHGASPHEGCAMQWNGQSGVREYRVAPQARPDSRAPDEEPERVCIGEICEPLS